MLFAVSLSSPELAELIVPHTSRLVGLTVRATDLSLSLSRIAEHLRHPIPTLHTFCVSTDAPRLHKVEVPSSIRDAFFIHSRKLDLEGISSFHTGTRLFLGVLCKPFPHVTELTLRTSEHGVVQIIDLLDTLGQLPMLERVLLTFTSDWYDDGALKTITLPLVQEMSIFVLETAPYIPPVFKWIKLPKLNSLHVQSPPPTSVIIYPILPKKSFDEYLPNLTYLPEVRVTMTRRTIEVVFRNPQAAFRYVTTGEYRTYRRDRGVWGALPLHSVRRLIVDIWEPQEDTGGGWFDGLLQDLPHLEHLEFEGDCDGILKYLCHEIVQGGPHLRVQTLIARAAREHAARDFNLDTAVARNAAPGVRDGSWLGEHKA